MYKIAILAASLLLPAWLAAQNQPVTTPAPATTQAKEKAAAPAKVYSCEQCKLTFKNAKEAKKHFKKVHKMNYCAKCNEAFTTEAEFKAHNKDLHSKKNTAK